MAVMFLVSLISFYIPKETSKMLLFVTVKLKDNEHKTSVGIKRLW